MKKKLKLVIFIILNFVEFCILALSTCIYLSFFEWSPWYEPLGYQFIALFYLIPFHIIPGLIMFFLNRNQGVIGNILKSFPFLSIGNTLLFLLPQHIDIHSERLFIYKVASLGIFLFTAFLIINVINLINIYRSRLL